MNDFDEFDYELFMAFNDRLIEEGNNFYAKVKDIPYPLFFSMLCVLIEQKCADEGLNLMEMYLTMMQTAKDVQDKLGPMIPSNKINE